MKIDSFYCLNYDSLRNFLNLSEIFSIPYQPGGNNEIFSYCNYLFHGGNNFFRIAGREDLLPASAGEVAG